MGGDSPPGLGRSEQFWRRTPFLGEEVVTVAWVGYNYLAQVATPVVVLVDQTVHCPRGPSLLETPIIHGRRGEAENGRIIFYYKTLLYIISHFGQKISFFSKKNEKNTKINSEPNSPGKFSMLFYTIWCYIITYFIIL
jgi:hypothetical protein